MLLHYTKDYHKLVEFTGRVCYQSYDKVNEESHKMLRGIMGKGHLSVASVGNMVFAYKFNKYEQLMSALFDLIKLKEISNYVRWTTKNKMRSNYDLIVSFNVLTLMDIHKGLKETNHYNHLYEADILPYIQEVPELNWFIDETQVLEPTRNCFLDTAPDLLAPVLLAEDYSALKENLNPYELLTHVTATLDILTDRATGLQMWRHGDMTGGCELSQRYVDRSKAKLRLPAGLNEEDDLYLLTQYHEVMLKYDDLKFIHADKGKKRATEIARSILPNAMTTRIIQCRPLRQWKHFFDLRLTPHAQKEIQEDAQSMYALFEQTGMTDVINFYAEKSSKE